MGYRLLTVEGTSKPPVGPEEEDRGQALTLPWYGSPTFARIYNRNSLPRAYSREPFVYLPPKCLQLLSNNGAWNFNLRVEASLSPSPSPQLSDPFGINSLFLILILILTFLFTLLLFIIVSPIGIYWEPYIIHYHNYTQLFRCDGGSLHCVGFITFVGAFYWLLFLMGNIFE